MSTFPKPREGVTVKKTKIKIIGDKKEYIISEYTSADTISIYIGGKTLFCIQGQLYKKDSPFSRLFDITQGNLLHLYYNEKCDLSNSFKRTIDTHKMLKLLISYIQRHYTYIKTLKFKDVSTRECDNKTVVDLSIMSFLIYGKTWYERHFNAYLSDKYKPLFDNDIIEFNNKKEKIKWDMMKSYIIVNFPLPENEMRQIYDTATTWRDFFSGINDKIGIKKFCIFISPWIHTFISSTFNFDVKHADYIFQIDNPAFKPYFKYNSVPYIEEKPLVKGGNRKRLLIKYTKRRKGVN